jgi:hypothetical protein
MGTSMRNVFVSIIKYFYRLMVRKPKELIRSYYYREKRERYGEENADQTFYIIRRQDSYIGSGLFSHVITTVAHIKYAVEKGYVPVVDMMNYPNLYISKNELHKVNPWDYYFEQPGGYKVEDIKSSKNIILSNGGIPTHRPNAILPKEELSVWKEYTNKYIKLIPEVENKINKEWSYYVKPNMRVLGVLCRGTDYIARKPKGHPKQPDINMVIHKVKEIFSDEKAYGFSKIFLATEDKMIYDKFKDIFGDAIYTNKKHFV